MNVKMKLFCCLLCICMIVSVFAGCGTDTNEKYVSDRPLAEKTDSNTNLDDTTKAEYTYEATKWSGPEGYTIVLPENEKTQYQESAELLNKYFLEKYKVDVPIVFDTVPQTEKEILLGHTNRSVSENEIPETEYIVSYNDDKLIFESGHWLGVIKAVKWFTTLDVKEGSVNTLKGTFEFYSSVNDGYEYVWGDEFDGNTLDTTKWTLGDAMKGTGMMKLSDEPEVISVKDGQLKLNAIHYYNAKTPQYEYAVPYSIMTNETMVYQYGYLEMKAKVPFKQGSWPSLWMNNKQNKIGPARTSDYFVEVDIFEVFSSVDTVSPNIHKWYDDGVHTMFSQTEKTNELNADDKNKSYQFSSVSSLNDEYHIYGFEWTPTEMSMYVDGEKYMTYDLTFNYDGKSNMKGFSDAQCLIINNHIYTPDSENTNSKVEITNSSLPCNYHIDYIRLYQKKDAGKIWTK